MVILNNLSVLDFLFNYSRKYNLYIEGEVKSFKNVLFSRSSMSVYIPVVKDDNIHNHMIITYKDNNFVFDGVELIDKESNEHIKVQSLDFNDKEHFHEHINSKTIEDAMNTYNVYTSIKNVRSTLYPSNSKLTWNGNNNDYSKEHCVIAKCEYKPLGPKASVDLLMKIANQSVANLTDMQKMTLALIQKHPETLQKTYEVSDDTDIAQNIYNSAALLYMYRFSCMQSEDLEFPVIISPFLWIVKENDPCNKSTVF